jgi:hypothetical protein
MNTNFQNINNNNNNLSGENSMSVIQQLFNEFVNQGGNPKVTEFKKHIDELISNDIKPLCTRSGKTGDNWRSDLKSKFSGRGAKWVFVSLENIEATLLQFESNGIDCTEYRKNITKLGKAWVRFNGARINEGIKCAAFEVRTEGSTIDHPKQLHMINIEGLDNLIEAMPGTPKALKIEEDSAPLPKTKAKAKSSSSSVKKDSALKAMADEINEELKEESEMVELNEPPQSDDPSEWEAFLAAEGLINTEMEEFDSFNDDL